MDNPEPDTTTVILCAKCGQEGAIVWETDAKAKRTILSISDGFYRRVQGNHSKPPTVICDNCGTVLKSHALSATGSAANENTTKD
jgi:hypothetical protein